jgi:elongation factor P
MPKANELKRGAIVRFKDQVCTVRHIDIRAPSSRGSNTLYKIKLQDVRTRQNIDHTFKGEDHLPDVDYARRQASYSYFDGELHVFMDSEDFTQYSLSPDDLEGQVGYITEDMEAVLVMIIEDQPVGIQLPPSVILEVTETSPSIKGATVTKRTKPAILSTGLEVQVPEYLSQGEKIKVNTETGEFVSRA